MTQPNIVHLKLSPQLKTLVKPTPHGLIAGDQCLDVTHYLKKSTRNNPEDSAVPLYEEYAVEEVRGMCHNYASVLGSTFNRPTEALSIVTSPFSVHVWSYSIPTIEKHRYFLQESAGKYTYLQRIDQEPKQNPIRVSETSVADKMFDFLVLADYAKGSLNAANVAELRSLNKGEVYVDTKDPSPAHYKGCTVKMNNDEFERTRSFHYLFKRIIHTKGAEGVDLIYPQQSHKNITLPGSGVNPVNVSGAGDIFFATFIGCEQYLGLDEFDALLLATTAAGISIKHHTTYVPTLEEILNVIRTKYTTAE